MISYGLRFQFGRWELVQRMGNGSSFVVTTGSLEQCLNHAWLASGQPLTIPLGTS